MLSFKSDNKKKNIVRLNFKVGDIKKNIKLLYCKSNGVKKYLFVNESNNRFYLLKKGTAQVSYVLNNSNGTYTAGVGFQVSNKYYHPVFNKSIASAISEGYVYLCYKISSTNGTGADFGTVNNASITTYSWSSRKPLSLSVGNNIIRIKLSDCGSGYPSVCMCNMNDNVLTDTQLLSDVWFERRTI